MESTTQKRTIKISTRPVKSESAIKGSHIHLQFYDDKLVEIKVHYANDGLELSDVKAVADMLLQLHNNCANAWRSYTKALSNDLEVEYFDEKYKRAMRSFANAILRSPYPVIMDTSLIMKFGLSHTIEEFIDEFGLHFINYEEE